MPLELPACVPVQAYIVEGGGLVADLVERMREHLSPEQARILAQVAEEVFCPHQSGASNDHYIESFIEAKSVEGCSPRTTRYYLMTIREYAEAVPKPFRDATPQDIRQFLAFKRQTGCSDVTLDNVRRILSSFFQWLEDEEVVRKSPVKRVKAIKCEKSDKKPFSDRECALIKEQAARHGRSEMVRLRDSAIVELFLSSGMRVGELVLIDVADVDFERREVEVLGKGRKRRMCYFSAEAALLMERYLQARGDDGEPAMFVAEQRSGGRRARIQISGVESRIRDIGRAAGVPKCHPHRFRRTMATKNLSRGMGIEQIRDLLGHENIETTMIYAKVDKELTRGTALRMI